MEMPHDSKIKIPIPPPATLLKLYWMLMYYLSKVSGVWEYEEGRGVQKAFGKNELLLLQQLYAIAGVPFIQSAKVAINCKQVIHKAVARLACLSEIYHLVSCRTLR